MLVRLLQSRVSDMGMIPRGVEIQVPDAEGRRMIQDNQAIPVEARKPETPERAVGGKRETR